MTRFSVRAEPQLAEGVTIDDPPLVIEVDPRKQAVVPGAADQVVEAGIAGSTSP